MDLRFGNAETYAELKEAYEANDGNRLYELIGEDVHKVCTMLLRQSKYTSLNKYDREDAQQYVWMRVQTKLLGSFFKELRNDPASENCYTPIEKNAFLKKSLFRILADWAKESYKLAKIDSLDRPLSSDGETTVGDLQPDHEQDLEKRIMRRSLLQDMMRTFFSLNNAPEFLACIGFMILKKELERTSFDYDDYAHAFNGLPVLTVARSIKALLLRNQMDCSMLQPLLKRLHVTKETPKGDGRIIQGLTASTLRNRKNSMLTTLRMQLDLQLKEDDYYV